ncbi:MAG: redoxin domain-containing protein, partial [Deltaproteobacteria bacterium]|nr:redoxin domain-containing protein [Deltaproteobacteria bacterium]
QLVTVTVAGTGSVRSTIRYYSDDPDEPESIQYVYKNNTTFPQIGSVAPDFTLPGNDGQSHSLSDYLGRVIYLEFGASW